MCQDEIGTIVEIDPMDAIALDERVRPVRSLGPCRLKIGADVRGQLPTTLDDRAAIVGLQRIDVQRRLGNDDRIVRASFRGLGLKV